MFLCLTHLTGPKRALVSRGGGGGGGYSHVVLHNLTPI